ncbi:MAG TPA: acyloxyacyl hydrolase [Pyrinomonadaceae bacterium]|nr:acyloxyacyl hydrolase [Pyrinomonadaceae bacterium]
MIRNGGAVVILLLLAAAAAAQERASLAPGGSSVKPAAGDGEQLIGGSYGSERPVNEYGVWGGFSPGSPTLIGKTEGARLGVVAVRFARLLARGDHVALKYTLDAVPLASLSFPAGGGERKTITGAGLSPVGFQVNFRRREKWQPFAQASGGFLYFGERVPDRDGAQFNFTADFGGGVQWKVGARRAWTVGYRYQHLSNGYRAANNPGFDANLFYVGYSIFR